jgi:hypothetical protein
MVRQWDYGNMAMAISINCDIVELVGDQELESYRNQLLSGLSACVVSLPTPKQKGPSKKKSKINRIHKTVKTRHKLA